MNPEPGTPSMADPQVSIVVPVFNEAEVLKRLVHEFVDG